MEQQNKIQGPIYNEFQMNKINDIKARLSQDNDLTLKQKLFITNYIDNGGKLEQAVLMAWYNPGALGGKGKSAVAVTIGNQNLNKAWIKKYLDWFVDLAGANIVHIMNNWKEENRLKASTFVYEHVHWKATQKVEQSVSFSLSWLSSNQADYNEINIVDTDIIEDNIQDEDNLYLA